MNFKNYKLEVLTLIDEYRNEKNKENKKISEDDTISNSVNEAENEIKLLDDNNCLNTEFLDDIWLRYCKELPHILVVALFNYTSFKNQTICWEISNNPEIIFIENLSYKINLPAEKIKGILKSAVTNDKNDIFYDILDLPIIFDLNDKQWHIDSDIIYGLTNTYSLETAKELCKIQYQIKEDEKKAKQLVKQAAEEAKRKEKEKAKEEKRKAKELEKELKRQEKLKKSISEGTKNQNATSKKKALKQLKSNVIQTQLKF